MSRRTKKAEFRSGLESRVVRDLKRRRAKFSYESTSLEWFPKPRWYTPDIEITPTFFVEIKGKFTSADRSKMLQVKEAHPEIRIAFLFQRNNFIRKGSKTTYAMWARQHGFEWHIGERIPDKWLTTL